MYERGHGVPQDFEQAAYWYTLAIQGGSTAAEQRLKLIVVVIGEDKAEQIRRQCEASFSQNSPPRK